MTTKGSSTNETEATGTNVSDVGGKEDGSSRSDQRDLVDGHIEDWLKEFPDLDVETEGLISRIHKISRYIDRILSETAAEFDLSLADWQLLGSLRRGGPPYELTPGQLAERLMISPAAMTSRLDRLEERGLIARHPDPNDRRVTRVQLTKDGVRVWGDAVDVQAAREQMVAASLNEKQKRELNNHLRKLLNTCEEIAGAPPPPRSVADQS